MNIIIKEFPHEARNRKKAIGIRKQQQADGREKQCGSGDGDFHGINKLKELKKFRGLKGFKY